MSTRTKKTVRWDDEGTKVETIEPTGPRTIVSRAGRVDTELIRPKTARRSHHEGPDKRGREPWWLLKSLGYDVEEDDVPPELVERAYRDRPREPPVAQAPAKEPVKRPAVAAPASCTPASIPMAPSRDPEALLQQADEAASTLTSGDGIWKAAIRLVKSSFGKTYDADDVAKMYEAAAVAFTLQKQGLRAGQAYERAATVYKTSDYSDYSAGCLEKASSAYMGFDNQAAARCLQAAIDGLAEGGHFSRAASYQETLSQLYQKQMKDPGRAIEALLVASEWLGLERLSKRRANGTRVQAAALLAEQGEYNQALQIYENAAQFAFGDPGLILQVPKYYFSACICLLATYDPVTFSQSLNNYCEMSRDFASTKKPRFLYELSQALEQGDEDAFKNIKANFTRTDVLGEPWHEKVLAKIEKSIQEKPDDFS